MRDDVEEYGFRTMIGSPDANEELVFVFIVFGIFDGSAPVMVLIENVTNFAIAVETFLGEMFVWVFHLGIFVEVFYIRVCGSEVLLLEVAKMAGSTR